MDAVCLLALSARVGEKDGESEKERERERDQDTQKSIAIFRLFAFVSLSSFHVYDGNKNGEMEHDTFTNFRYNPTSIKSLFFDFYFFFFVSR